MVINTESPEPTKPAPKRRKRRRRVVYEVGDMGNTWTEVVEEPKKFKEWKGYGNGY